MINYTVFGMQRSGTTFMETLLKDCFNASIKNTFSSGFIWKHAFNIDKAVVNTPGEKFYTLEKYHMIGDQIRAIHIHKNPYTWIESILRHSRTRNMVSTTYPDVLRQRSSDQPMVNGLNLCYLAELWTKHSAYWLNVAEQKRVFRIQYEELIKGKSGVRNTIHSIAKFWDLGMPGEINIPTVVHSSDEFTNEKRQYYLNQKPTQLTEKQIARINEWLHPTVMEQLEYSYYGQTTDRKVNLLQQEVKHILPKGQLHPPPLAQKHSEPAPKVYKNTDEPPKESILKVGSKVKKAEKVLLIASGMSAIQYKDYDYKGNGWTIVAINNGWQAVPGDWDYWIRPSDFKGLKPTEKDTSHGGKIVEKYGPQLNNYGGQKACGYSITLNAAYWALAELRPTILGFLGADMNYTPDSKGDTHIYGVGWDIKNKGVADPDRMAEMYKGQRKGAENETAAEYLDYIYKRLATTAEIQSCQVYNLSYGCDTRLPYQRQRAKRLNVINKQ